MLSEELRNLSIWLRARRQPVEISVIIHMLEELAEQAEQLERGTRLMSADEVAERIALEAYRP
jgi:hypothetical protein